MLLAIYERLTREIRDDRFLLSVSIILINKLRRYMILRRSLLFCGNPNRLLLFNEADGESGAGFLFLDEHRRCRGVGEGERVGVFTVLGGRPIESLGLLAS